MTIDRKEQPSRRRILGGIAATAGVAAAGAFVPARFAHRRSRPRSSSA